jgi:hypothetical protein
VTTMVMTKAASHFVASHAVFRAVSKFTGQF